jgi:hypothetical protein
MMMLLPFTAYSKVVIIVVVAASVCNTVVVDAVIT